MSNEEDSRRLVQAFVNFLENQLISRENFSVEDTDGLLIAIECLQMAYNLEDSDYVHRRSLLDMFLQLANPVSVKDKLEAESLKTEANQKMHEQHYIEADEYYTRAIQLDKWNPIYYVNRSAARIKLDHFFEAINDCRQALMLSPDYAKAYDKMGQAYASMNRHERAARCFRQAVRLEPDNERYTNNLTVAENQNERASTGNMETLLQNVLGSILGGGPQGGSSPLGMSPFMIISEPHSSRDCNTSGIASSDSQNSTATLQQDSQDANQDSTRSADGDESVHLRVLLGIPRLVISDEEDPNQQTESNQNTLHSSDTAITDKDYHGDRQGDNVDSDSKSKQKSNEKNESENKSSETHKVNQESNQNQDETTSTNKNTEAYKTNINSYQTSDKSNHSETNTDTIESENEDRDRTRTSDNLNPDPFQEIVASMTASMKEMMRKNTNGKSNYSKMSEAHNIQNENSSRNGENPASQSTSSQPYSSTDNKFKNSNGSKNESKSDTSPKNEDLKEHELKEKDTSNKNALQPDDEIKNKTKDHNDTSDVSNENKDEKFNQENSSTSNKMSSFFRMFGKSDNNKDDKKPENNPDKKDSEKPSDSKK